MGWEAACTARIEGRSVKGVALLETKEILFRGPERLKILLADIKQLKVAGGALTVVHAGGEVVLSLGADAAKWRERILHPPSRLQKLGLKPGMKVAVMGALARSELEEIAACVGQRPAAPKGGEQVVFLVAEKKSDLAALARLGKSIDPAGAIWVVRRKGKDAPVTEAESMAAGKAAGLVDTKVVAFSDTHTAERYVIPVALRSAGRAR